MTNPSPHEQIRQQRALARAQRRWHGQETALDRAEERYEAVKKRVNFLRRGVFLITPLPAALVDTGPPGGFMASCVITWIALVGGTLLGRVSQAVSGAFKPGIWHDTENTMMILGGLTALGLGGAAGSLGVQICGGVMVGWTLIWPRWSRNILDKTDYARMLAAQGQRQHLNRIME